MIPLSEPQDKIQEELLPLLCDTDITHNLKITASFKERKVCGRHLWNSKIIIIQ